MYRDLGDNEKAMKAFEIGVKAAVAMYKEDNDAEDPNVAPKAYWPSTNECRNLVDAGYTMNAGLAVSLQEIPDDEIKTFAQISLAKRLLGSSKANSDTSMCRISMAST